MRLEDRGAYDVIVAGGGPAGFMAGIAAARCGARTLLIERNGYVGGLAASGLPILTFHDRSGRRIIGGLPQEFIDRLEKIGGTPGHVSKGNGHQFSMTPLYPEEVKFLTMEMLLEAGAELMLDTEIVGALTEGTAVSGLIVHNPGGLQTVRATTTIDCTGDGDVIARSGADFSIGRTGDGGVQSLTLLFLLGGVDVETACRYLPDEVYYAVRPGERNEQIIHLAGSLETWRRAAPDEFPFADCERHKLWAMVLRPGLLSINLTDVAGVDPTSGAAITAAEIEARRQVMQLKEFLRRHVPGFANCYLISTPARIGGREGRRLRGMYEMQREDVIHGGRFPDSIGLGGYCMDLHDPSGGGITFTPIEGGGSHQIPYRCLVPEKMDGLLAAGRCLSASHEALAALRVMGTCMVTGQAAGTAAALATRLRVRVRDITGEFLQAELRKYGAILE